jgi:hypothetical protein
LEGLLVRGEALLIIAPGEINIPHVVQTDRLREFIA